jgi:hypothetical protein
VEHLRHERQQLVILSLVHTALVLRARAVGLLPVIKFLVHPQHLAVFQGVLVEGRFPRACQGLEPRLQQSLQSL